MRPRLFGTVLVLALLGMAGWMAWGDVDRTAPVQVRDLTGQKDIAIVLTDAGFEPRDVRVTRGTRVTFTTTRAHKFWPASNAHPSHDIYREFDPKRPIEPSDPWSFVFDRVGVWGFHDHVRSYFTGTIHVEE